MEAEYEGSYFLAVLDSHLGDAPLCLSLFFRWVCHTFFISLSVRPGNFKAIADHLNLRSERINHQTYICIYEHNIFEFMKTSNECILGRIHKIRHFQGKKDEDFPERICISSWSFLSYLAGICRRGALALSVCRCRFAQTRSKIAYSISSVLF